MKHKLTKEQSVIVKALNGMFAIYAAAGSGKTWTLCERIRHLIDSQRATSDDILVLSFSNKAVRVLKERLGPEFNVMTFHAFGIWLIEQHDASRPDILTPAKSSTLLRNAISVMPILCRNIRQRTGVNLATKVEWQKLSSFFSATQEDADIEARLVGDAESPFAVYDGILDKLRRLRRRYNALMKDSGSIDYPGMLRRGRKALENVTLPYKFVFVDEYQDMSAAQARLLSAIAEYVPNVMVFGDPQQAIFGFMGGQFHDVRSVLGDGVKKLRLTRSFRLTHQTAASATAISKGKPIVGHRDGVRPTLSCFKSEPDQEQAIVALVKHLKENQPGKSTVVLGRTKAQLRSIDKALRVAGHHTAPLYDEQLPEHIDQLLKLLAVLNRDVEVFRNRKLTKDQCAKLEQKIADITQCDVLPATLAAARRDLVKGALSQSFSGRYQAAVGVYLKMIRASGEKHQDIAKEFGRWAALSNHCKTAKALRSRITKQAKQSAIILSTIHGAKGDEWDHVIIVGVTEGSIPIHYEMKRGPSGIEEERRLFYVAVTRARGQAHLFHAPYRHAPSRQLFEKPSRFLTKRVCQTLDM